MAGRNHGGIRRNDDFGSNNHLSLPESDTSERDTIYKLRLSMRRRLSPQSIETPSPQGSGELRGLVQRLVEIDTESREVLGKVFSMLEKDEKLENYFKKRIEDPKVSKMWQLVEQVVACQEDSHNYLDGLICGNSDNYNNNFDFSSDTSSVIEKGIILDDEVEEETKLEKFRVRTLDAGGGGGVIAVGK